MRTRLMRAPARDKFDFRSLAIKAFCGRWVWLACGGHAERFMGWTAGFGARMQAFELVETVEGGFGFVVEGFGFGVLLAEAVDDVGWSFGHEGFVVQLFVCGFEALFVFGEVFGEAFAFGGDVDLALVDDGYVKVGGRACV